VWPILGDTVETLRRGGRAGFDALVDARRDAAQQTDPATPRPTGG